MEGWFGSGPPFLKASRARLLIEEAGPRPLILSLSFNIRLGKMDGSMEPSQIQAGGGPWSTEPRRSSGPSWKNFFCGCWKGSPRPSTGREPGPPKRMKNPSEKRGSEKTGLSDLDQNETTRVVK